jgi:hypothetical protein
MDQDLLSNLEPRQPYLPRAARPWRKRLLSHLPEAKESVVDGQLELRTQDELRVAFRLTVYALELRLPRIRWVSPHETAYDSKMWQAIPWSELSEDCLPQLIRSLQQARRDEFGYCASCERAFPPEYMWEESMCMGCAPVVF